MHTTANDLVVGRDRAHVRSLLATYPHQEVVSASQFFDKTRSGAFIYDHRLILDDNAPLLLAQRLLNNHQLYSLRFAKNFASLYAACFHGASRPREVLDALLPEHEKFRVIFSLLAQIDDEMQKRGLVTSVTALFIARQMMIERAVLPPHLVQVSRIALHHLIDLTMLEIDTIKTLSRLGLPFTINFPMDFKNRGINGAVSFAASLFERDVDIVNINLEFERIAGADALMPLVESLFTDARASLSHDSCSIEYAPSVLSEADRVAEKIVALKMSRPHDSIALVMRTMDARAEIFKQALLRHGISVRDRKGVPLIKTNAGVLLSTLFAARAGIKKIHVQGLVAHPLFCEHISDGAQRSSVLQLVRDLGIDNRIVFDQQSFADYRARIARYRRLLHDADNPKLPHLDHLLAWFNAVEEMLALLPEHGTVKQFLANVLALCERAMKTDDASVESLRSALVAIHDSSVLLEDESIVALPDFVNWITSELTSLTMPRPDNRDLHAVEFLLLPEMLGRQFHHVFIADMAFGRLPKSTPPDALLDDSDRAALNRLMKKPLLRIFFDDPFEPMPTPPRQALEPFWFAEAIAAASASVHFSSAMRDENHQEQAPSEFFTWLVEHVDFVDEKALDSEKRFVSAQQKRFHDGVRDRLAPSAVNDALTTRSRGFAEQQAHPFFFAVDASLVHEAFAGRLPPHPIRALSPTLIETFADCRLRGFLERIVKLDNNVMDADDVDARIIGQIAHLTLERFFADDVALSSQRFYERLRTILEEAIHELGSTIYVSNPDILVCHQEWLFDALLSLIMQLQHTSSAHQTTTIHREVDMGFGGKTPPLKLAVDGAEYLVGGRIDRIDKSRDGFLIIDYKLSASDSLRAQLSKKNVLHKNFQAPIYLRLVAKHLAHDEKSKVSFTFASIRDADVLPPLNYADNHELYQRIFNDDEPESLAHTVHQVFLPLTRGAIPAQRGEHCKHCDFSLFCRRRVGENHGC